MVDNKNITGKAGSSSTRGEGKTSNIKSPTGSNPKPPDERIMSDEPSTDQVKKDREE